jgi:hypothetical protein
VTARKTGAGAGPQSAQALVGAPLPNIRAVLLEPLSLPAWNPAFQTISGSTRAVVGADYPIHARGLRGTFTYTDISDTRIGMAWRVPGFAETATWELKSVDGDTLVTHRFEHSGPLAFVLSRAYQGVAALRLHRLADRLDAARTAVGTIVG